MNEALKKDKKAFRGIWVEHLAMSTTMLMALKIFSSLDLSPELQIHNIQLPLLHLYLDTCYHFSIAKITLCNIPQDLSSI